MMSIPVREADSMRNPLDEKELLNSVDEKDSDTDEAEDREMKAIEGVI